MIKMEEIEKPNMSNSSELILRRLIIYLQDVEHILRHEILSPEEIDIVQQQLKDCFKWFAEIQHRLDEQRALMEEIK